MSKARSPRDVCSITMGTSGLMQAPCCRGSTILRSGLGFSFSGVQSLSRARELDRDPLDLGRDPVEGLAQPEVGAQRVVAAGFTDLGRELLGVFGVVRLLADQLVDLLVGDLDAELVGRAFEHDLAQGSGEPLPRCRPGSPGRAVAELQVRLGADPAALERADEGIPELDRASLDEPFRHVELGGVDERVHDRGPELRVELGLELAAQAALDLLAELVQRRELGRCLRELVVHRQDLLVQLLHVNRDSPLGSVGLCELDVLLGARLGSDQRLLDLGQEAARAELDDIRAAPRRRSRPGRRRGRRPRAPGVPRRGESATVERAPRARRRSALRNLRLGRRDLQRGPVSHLGLGLHGDGRRELEGIGGEAGSS